MAKTFEADWLPKLRELAEAQGVTLRVVDLQEADGAPAEVGITPLIVYQNHLGRSVYQGRYTTLDRVRNFIRTARYRPQGDAPLVRKDLMVREVQSGCRPLIGMPIKITSLEGSVPADFDHDAFEAMAMGAINRADSKSYLEGRVELGRSDRLFYFDFYPYRSEAGELYVGLAVYSQFHCHEPVFTSSGTVHGPWAERAAVFAEAFRTMSAAVDRLLAESEVGDGFDAVPESLALKSWDELGLTLPDAPPAAEGGAATGDVELVHKWEIEAVEEGGGAGSQSAVMFAFPAPLDGYAGEATRVTGTLTLGEGLSLPGMTGTIHADPASVTMGEPDLDDAIHDTMLHVEKYPDATFEVTSVETGFDQPRFGQVTAATLVGTFTMKGRSVPLRVPTSIEAYIGDDGRPRLSVEGRWELRLSESFGLDGPPGEAPANDTLEFTCQLVLEPSGLGL